MVSSFLLLALTLQSPPPATRPRDIWVFRSVLDKRARMATVALHNDLWVAYDATNCGLYRAWKGGVKFDGAVYTAEHGPQPTVLGSTSVMGVVDKQVWYVRKGSTRVAKKPEFKGYAITKNQVTFEYQFRMDGRTIVINETPEYVASSTTFERTFRVEGLKNGEAVELALGDPGRETTSTGTPLVQGPDGWSMVATNGTMQLRHRLAGLSAAQSHQLASFTSALSAEVSAAPDEQEQGPSRQAGVALRVYYIGQSLSQIPELVAMQSPNYSVVIPKIDLPTVAKWGPNDEQFYAKLTGYITVKEPGAYTFRLTSDDGSRFSIRDERIIDHDGLHGPEPKDGRFTLAAGDHPFEIEYFENSGGEELKLEWQRPGRIAYEVIPAEAFWTPAGEVRVTAPGKKSIVDPYKRRKPGDGIPLAGVHPSFDLATVRPKDFKPRVGGIDFLPDGRMVVCTWDADGAVYVLDGVQAKDPSNIKVKRIAAGLAEPLGLKVVNGKIYVLQKQELTRLDDLDGDEVIDRYFAVANGWGVTSNFHEFAFGLIFHKGHFYANLATAIDPGGRSTQPQEPDRGRVVKIAMDGSYSFVAAGLRTPNGIGYGFNGEVYISDNQGDWLPSSKIVHLREGAFYGNRSVEPVAKRLTKEDPPVVWLPQGEIGNSPSQIAPLNVGPYRNQQIHGEVTHGGVKRVFVEDIDGILQGCVFRFTQGLEAGINRIQWGPDKALYVGGIGAAGNWGQEGKERFGLQRLTYNNKPTFEMLAVRSKANGFEIEFTRPLMVGSGDSVHDYAVRSWKYVPTAVYGGPKVDEMDHKLASVNVSKDRRKAFLEIPGLQEGRVVYFRLSRGILSSSDEELWSTEGWYTLNKLPKTLMGQPGPKVQANVLSPSERSQGFTLLFDGKSTSSFRGFKKDGMPTAWQAIDGELRFTPGSGSGGDIVTREQYDNFELRLEWKVARGGNSGIMFRCTEDKNYPWETGPEMQVLDDEAHPDGANVLTSAGSCYALIARGRDVARPAGQWNEIRIVANGSKVEYWMNGFKVVNFDFDSAEWKKLIASSKFASMPDFGKRSKGHIALQDHGDRVAYRSIRIRKL